MAQNKEFHKSQNHNATWKGNQVWLTNYPCSSRQQFPGGVWLPELKPFGPKAKNISQIGSFPQVGVKITIFETTTYSYNGYINPYEIGLMSLP